MKGALIVTVVSGLIAAGMYLWGGDVRPYFLVPLFVSVTFGVPYLGNLLLGHLPR